MYRKARGREAKLRTMGHALMENRNGLAAGAQAARARGTAEREASEAMRGAKTRETGKAASVGEDKAHDAGDKGKNLRAINVTPMSPANGTTKTGKLRKTIADGATAAGEAYGLSQTRRKMIECIFGWGKQHGTMRKTKHRGMATVARDFLINIIAYKLIRIPKLLAAEGGVRQHRPSKPQAPAKPAYRGSKITSASRVKAKSHQTRRFFSKLLKNFRVPR